MTQKTLYEGFCKVVEVDMKNNTGSYKRELVKMGDSVAGVVADKYKVLFVRQNRPAFNNLIELPAGKVKKDNALDSELSREILEETGYNIPETRMSRMCSVAASPGILDEVIHIFRCDCDCLEYFIEGEGGGLAEENEEIELILFFHHDLLTYKENNISFTNKLNFQDAKTIVGLSMYYNTMSQKNLKDMSI